jgi:hypothetical protein
MLFTLQLKSITNYYYYYYYYYYYILARHLLRSRLPYIERSLRRLLRRPEHLIDRHCGISRQTEGHSFGDHLISESVSITPSSVIEAFIMLCYVSVWVVWVSVQSACALNTRISVVLKRNFHICNSRIVSFTRINRRSLRKLHTEELHNLYSLTNINRMIKSKRMECSGSERKVELFQNCNSKTSKTRHIDLWYSGRQ